MFLNPSYYGDTDKKKQKGNWKIKEDTLYTYTRMVFNLGEPNSSLFLSEFSQLVRSNSNHQKTLLRFDPRGKSLSSSLLPSESSSALVIFGRRDKSPSTSWSPSPKFFLPFLCTFHRKEMLRDSRKFNVSSSPKFGEFERTGITWRCYHIPRYFYQEFFLSSKR